MLYPIAIGKNWPYYCSVDMAYLYKGGSLGRCCKSREGSVLSCCLRVGFPNMGSLPKLAIYMDAKDLYLWLRVASKARDLDPSLYVESSRLSGEVDKVVLVWGECRAMSSCLLLTGVVGLF